MAIDYFSRFHFAKVIDIKQSCKILEFLKRVNSIIRIKNLVADNGKEFHHKEFFSWAKNNKINLEFSVPYYHESNGWIEHANRTIGDALKRSKGILNVKIRRVIDSYSNAIHRGLGMSPQEALDIKNIDNALRHQEIYKKEFRTQTKKR